MLIKTTFQRKEKNGFLVYETSAFIHNQKIGYLTFLWIPQDSTKIPEKIQKWIDHPEVGYVHVSKEWRRKGVATKLYHQTEIFLKDNFNLTLYQSDLITDNGKNLRKKIYEN